MCRTIPIILVGRYFYGWVSFAYLGGLQAQNSRVDVLGWLHTLLMSVRDDYVILYLGLR